MKVTVLFDVSLPLAWCLIDWDPRVYHFLCSATLGAEIKRDGRSAWTIALNDCLM